MYEVAWMYLYPMLNVHYIPFFDLVCPSKNHIYSNKAANGPCLRSKSCHHSHCMLLWVSVGKQVSETAVFYFFHLMLVFEVLTFAISLTVH